jgi:hypothetical protein
MNATWKFIIWVIYHVVKALLTSQPPNGDDVLDPNNGK